MTKHKHKSELDVKMSVLVTNEQVIYSKLQYGMTTIHTSTHQFDVWEVKLKDFTSPRAISRLGTRGTERAGQLPHTQRWPVNGRLSRKSSGNCAISDAHKWGVFARGLIGLAHFISCTLSIHTCAIPFTPHARAHQCQSLTTLGMSRLWRVSQNGWSTDKFRALRVHIRAEGTQHAERPMPEVERVLAEVEERRW
ncbi:uncharacterized protein C8Q71DRAFT_727769 [Rhodofomes roseus]|uniref:Uncharacterized protein n=1 Tax=Rhodofomes roseus TaxID=34475 RepID=A0ABQ8K048_9APHY|nr:uncharacterized protein C8Q71DRAFT_727769 [Rhodofomes roseus]KAH9830010.1 hypothetical protein C8Q71DRAFT_727769 [Rhodofomes roseus]